MAYSWRDVATTCAWAAAYLLLLGLIDPARAADLQGSGMTSGANQMDKALTQQEQARLLQTLKRAACADALGRRDDAAIRAMLHSGLRIGEFLRITVGDAMDALRTGYLFIPAEHRKGHSKGVAKDHTVYMTQALRRDIEDLLRVRSDIAAWGCRVEDPLIVGRSGDRLTVRAMQMRFKVLARAAGIERATPHWMRHTRAQNIMSQSTARDPRGVVKRALGHADIRSSGIYTETPREEVEAALDEVDAQAAGRISKAKLRLAWQQKRAA